MYVRGLIGYSRGEAMQATACAIVKIEVIFGYDHGTEAERWYVRRHYSDGTHENLPINEELDATDAELIRRYSIPGVTAKVVQGG
jgi:hypothetical protein